MNIPSGFSRLRTERTVQEDVGDAPRPPRVSEVEIYADADGVEFVLVPGAEEITLGWDAGFAPLEERTRQSILDDLERAADPLAGYTKWRATIDVEEEPEAAAWLDEQIEVARVEGPPELDEHQRNLFSPEGYADNINECTSPVRTISVPTLLVERIPQVLGWSDLGEVNVRTGESRLLPGHDDVVARSLEDLRSTDSDVLQTHGLARFHRGQDGWWRVECQEPTARADLLSRFAPFRLPTEDEWEFLADAAGGTLFRWGDALPDGPGSHGYGADPNLLDAPNINGIVIARDQFVMEIVAEPGIGKGGDGGGTMHDGLGLFDMMLPLATAFRASSVAGEGADLSGGYYEARRVIEV